MGKQTRHRNETLLNRDVVGWTTTCISTDQTFFRMTIRPDSLRRDLKKLDKNKWARTKTVQQEAIIIVFLFSLLLAHHSVLDLFHHFCRRCYLLLMLEPRG